jgi:hypothetical protein
MPFQKWIPLTALILCATACAKPLPYEDRPWVVGNVDGYAPVYDNSATLKTLSVAGPKTLQAPGKVLACGQFLLIPDSALQGIHVLDNSDPQHPENKYFLQVPGIAGASTKGNYLYVANYNDLVTLDLSSLPQIKETARAKAAIQASLYPPYQGVYFECVDTTRGTIIGWVPATLNNPKCRT